MRRTATKRWFTAIPMTYSETGGFWDRDAGLICLGLRELGVESKFVAWGTPTVREDVPLILATPEQMCMPEWWRQWQLDGVVIYSWAAPRYEPLVRAIKASGTRLAIKLDSDGLKAPHDDIWRYLSKMYWGEREAGKRLAAPIAVLKTLIHRFVPALFVRPMLKHMSHADIIAIESPLALQVCRRFLLRMGRLDLAARLRVCPHPVKLEVDYDPSVPKENLIIAVGRWESGYKDRALMIKVLGATLARESDYSAILVGGGEETLRHPVSKLPDPVRARISIQGRMPHAELGRLFLKCRVLLITSRYESFNIASAEALCRGCSVVGPAAIPSMNWFVSARSGALAARRTERDMSDALCGEIEAWRQGERNAVEMSHYWCDRLSAAAAARALLDNFK